MRFCVAFSSCSLWTLTHSSLVIGYFHRYTTVTRVGAEPALKSFDLITALLDIWHDIPVVARPQHVRGHQDDRIDPLTFLESLNVRMDLFTKSIAQTHIRNGCPDLTNSSMVGYGTNTIRGIMVCTNLQRTLYQSIHHQDMVTFLRTIYLLMSN